MGLVTSDFLAGLMTNFRAIFTQALGDAFAEKPLYQDIATKFDSTSDQESYGWLGANPSMSEWLDKRQLKSPSAYDYSLKNKHYEGTISVNREAEVVIAKALKADVEKAGEVTKAGVGSLRRR